MSTATTAASTSGSGSGVRKPSGSQDNATKSPNHQFPISPPPPSGNGTTPQTATWSTKSFPPGTRTYIVDALGLTPRYRRVTLDEARAANQVYPVVLDGSTFLPVQLPAGGNMANSQLPPATGMQQQLATVDEHENVIASQAYFASMVRAGDAFANSEDGGSSNGRGKLAPSIIHFW